MAMDGRQAHGDKYALSSWQGPAASKQRVSANRAGVSMDEDRSLECPDDPMEPCL